MITRRPRDVRLEGRTQAISMLMIIILVVFLVQLWLITIALEAHLAADRHLAVPTFVASGFCLALNLWLLKYLYDIDRTKE